MSPPKGSTTKWLSYFRTNPGSQEVAFGAVIRASIAIDTKYGTHITEDVVTNLIGNLYKRLP